LKALLEQEFPIQNLSAALPRTPVVLPWKDAEIKGICN
jgi:hypothetical protein